MTHALTLLDHTEYVSKAIDALEQRSVHPAYLTDFPISGRNSENLARLHTTSGPSRLIIESRFLYNPLQCLLTALRLQLPQMRGKFGDHEYSSSRFSHISSSRILRTHFSHSSVQENAARLVERSPCATPQRKPISACSSQ